jgi:hypothetical protein
MKLYRVMSEAEFQDLQATGRFRQGPNSLEGKWFAESAEHARAWGRLFELSFNVSHRRVVEVEISDREADLLFRLDRLDRIGPARFVEIDALGNVPFREVTE